MKSRASNYATNVQLKVAKTRGPNMADKAPRSGQRPPWIQTQLDQGYKPYSFIVEYHRTAPTERPSKSPSPPAQAQSPPTTPLHPTPQTNDTLLPGSNTSTRAVASQSTTKPSVTRSSITAPGTSLGPSPVPAPKSVTPSPQQMSTLHQNRRSPEAPSVSTRGTMQTTRGRYMEDNGLDDGEAAVLLRAGNLRPLVTGDKGELDDFSHPTDGWLPQTTASMDIDLGTMAREQNSKDIDWEKVLSPERDSLARDGEVGQKHSETENNTTSHADGAWALGITTESLNFKSGTSVTPVTQTTISSEASFTSVATEFNTTPLAGSVEQDNITESSHSSSVIQETTTMSGLETSESSPQQELTSSAFMNVTKLQIPMTSQLTNEPGLDPRAIGSQSLESLKDSTTDSGYHERSRTDTNAGFLLTTTSNHSQTVDYTDFGLTPVDGHTEATTADTTTVTGESVHVYTNSVHHPDISHTVPDKRDILKHDDTAAPQPSAHIPSSTQTGGKTEQPTTVKMKKQTQPSEHSTTTIAVPTTKRKRNRKRTRTRARTTPRPWTPPVRLKPHTTLRYPWNLLPSQSGTPVAYNTIWHTTPPTRQVVPRNSTFGAHTLSSGEVTGIAVGCIVAFWIILGPLVCFICKMRDKAHEKRRERQQEDSMSHTLIEEMIRLELARGRAKMYRTNVDDEREIERLPIQGSDCFHGNGCVINPQDYVIGNRYMEYTKIENPPDIKVDYHKEYILNKTYVDTLDIKKKDPEKRDTIV